MNLSNLIDMRDSAEESIGEIDDKIQDLSNAKYEVESFIEKLNDLISAIEDIDGYSVTVDVASFSVDFSIDL